MTDSHGPEIVITEVADPATPVLIVATRDGLDRHPEPAVRHARRAGFGGSRGEVMAVSIGEGAPAVFVAGLGDEAGLDGAGLRAAASTIVRGLQVAAVSVRGLVRLAADREDPDLVRAFVEGVVSGAYRYHGYRLGVPSQVHAGSAVTSVAIVADAPLDLTAAVEAGRRAGDAMALARDLVNEPPSRLTPRRFAERAGAVAEQAGLEIRVLDEDELERERCGAILAIGRGSAEPPRLVIARTPTVNPRVRLALVGKGITFDSGGLFIKGPQSMAQMKGDMGGAAAILGALSVAAAVAPDVEVTGYMALAENLLGQRPVKPGDVVVSRSGKTIEVNDPDGEGRVVLADALALASEGRPDAIVDLATLTGAKIQALGDEYGAVYGTRPELTERMIGAGAAAGEPLWPMPLVEAYRSRIDSRFADVRNLDTAPDCADSVSAALFLREFVDPAIPWAHVDFAGSEIAARDGLVPEGMATGWGARLLVALLRGYAGVA